MGILILLTSIVMFLTGASLIWEHDKEHKWIRNKLDKGERDDLSNDPS